MLPYTIVLPSQALLIIWVIWTIITSAYDNSNEPCSCYRMPRVKLFVINWQLSMIVVLPIFLCSFTNFNRPSVQWTSIKEALCSVCIALIQFNCTEFDNACIWLVSVGTELTSYVPIEVCWCSHALIGYRLFLCRQWLHLGCSEYWSQVWR